MSHYESTPVRPPKTQQQIMQEEIQRLNEQLRRAEREAAQKAAQEAAARNKQLKEATDAIMQDVKWAQQATEHRLSEASRAAEQRMRDALAHAQAHHAQQNAQLRQQMQQRIDQLGNQTRQQLDQLDRNHRQQMQQLSDNIYDSMGRMQQQLAGQINAVANSVSQLADQVEQRFEQTDQQIAAMQDNIQGIYQRFEDENKNAQEAVNAAVALLDKVEKRTLLDRFAPGYEASDIRGDMQNLLNSPNTGAALSAEARQVILKILQTESHAIQEQAKHNAMVEAVLLQADRVLSVVNANRVIKEDVEGGEPMEVENEFWSKGEYSQQEKRLKELQDELNDRYNPSLSQERIKEILKEISQIETRIQQICQESVTKAILSEARVETIEDIVNAMASHGWMLKGSQENPELNYMGGVVANDWREGVFAILERNTGETITIIVDPDGNDKNQLIVHQEGIATDEELQEKMCTICAELEEAGYQLPQGTPRQGYASMPEMASGERLGAPRATERVHSQMH